jgi:hypothetical protein
MWLHVPPQIFAYSPSAPAPAGSTPASSVSFRLLARSCTASGKRIPPLSWRRVWRRESWLRRLFGPTCNASQRERYAAVLTWWSAAFPANPSQGRASGAAPPTSAGSGRPSGTPSVGSGPPPSSSKTCPDSSITASQASLPTLSSTGGMRSGMCFPRPRSVLSRSAGGSSFWAAPAARDYRTPNLSASQGRRAGNESRGQQLSNQVVHQFPLFARPDGTIIERGDPSWPADPGSVLRLNPLFAEALMQLPPGWTCAGAHARIDYERPATAPSPPTSSSA